MTARFDTPIFSVAQVNNRARNLFKVNFYTDIEAAMEDLSTQIHNLPKTLMMHTVDGEWVLRSDLTFDPNPGMAPDMVLGTAVAKILTQRANEYRSAK